MLKQIMDNIKEKYPGVKTILSEITPRADNKDVEVQSCNKLIREFARCNQGNIFTAKHDNLRHPEGKFLYDAKHIKENIVPRFASNLKRALERAYDRERPSNRVPRTEERNTYRYHQLNENNSSEYHPVQYNNQNLNVFKNELKRRLLAAFDF